MTKKEGALNLFKLAAVVLMTAASFAFYACTKEQNAPDLKKQEKPQILTSSYVPYTLIKSLVKDTANVSMLMPPGIEPHSFEPLPKDILKIQKAKTFFYIDETLEPWAYEIKKDKAFALGQGLAQQNQVHIWMNFDKALLMAKRAAQNIQKNYPKLSATLNTNLTAFEQNINNLKTAYSDGLKNCKSKNIYHIGHLAFEELAKNYNLNFKPLVNSSEAQEPSPKDILEMIKQIKEHNIKYIFTEEALPQEMANLIECEWHAPKTTLENLKKYYCL